MRELTMEEVELVTGARGGDDGPSIGFFATASGVSAAAGNVWGHIKGSLSGLSRAQTAKLAAETTGRWGTLGAAFSAGYIGASLLGAGKLGQAIGQRLYETKVERGYGP